MSLNLKGMSREQAVDDSINHFQEMLNEYSEAIRILSDEYGFRPGTIPSESKRMRESMLNKYPKYTNIMPYLFDSIKKEKIRVRLENLKKVRSADKKGYLESLTLAHLVEAQSKDSKNRESAIFFLNDKLSQGDLAKAV